MMRFGAAHVRRLLSFEHIEHLFPRLRSYFGRLSDGSGITGKWSKLLAGIFQSRTAPCFQGDETGRPSGVPDCSATLVEMIHTHAAHFEAYRPILDVWKQQHGTGVLILDWAGDRALARHVIEKTARELRCDAADAIETILRTPSRRDRAERLLS